MKRKKFYELVDMATGKVVAYVWMLPQLARSQNRDFDDQGDSRRLRAVPFSIVGTRAAAYVRGATKTMPNPHRIGPRFVAAKVRRVRGRIHIHITGRPAR